MASEPPDEEDFAHLFWFEHRHQPHGQLNRWWVGGVLKSGVIGKLVELGFDRINDLSAVMSHIDIPERCDGV